MNKVCGGDQWWGMSVPPNLTDLELLNNCAGLESAGSGDVGPAGKFSFDSKTWGRHLKLAMVSLSTLSSQLRYKCSCAPSA